MRFECVFAAKRLFCALALTAAVIRPAAAQERPLNALLLDRLCAKTMLANEEDRFLGTISIAVRTTIKYEGGVFSPDLIDDAVQEASQAIVEACPKIAETDDAHRLVLSSASFATPPGGCLPTEPPLRAASARGGDGGRSVRGIVIARD